MILHFIVLTVLPSSSVVEIWKYMERFSGVKFLMGDLNAEPDSPTIRYQLHSISVLATK